jgi:hypothetical protein
MNGLLGLLLLVRARRSVSAPWFLSALLLATFFLSLGKQEWSIVLVIALTMWGGYLAFLKLRSEQDVTAEAAMLGVMFVGLVLGHLYSYKVDPVNYLGGSDLIVQMTKTQTVAAESGFDVWRKRTGRRLPMLLTNLALIGAAGVVAIPRWKSLPPTSLLLLLFGLGLFGAFFVSSWETDPRYFAPSLLVLTMSVVAFFPQAISWRTQMTLAGIILFVFGHSAYLFVRSRPMITEPNWLARGPQQQENSILLLPTGQGWNKPGIDFAGSSLGFEGAIGFAKKYGKSVHKPVHPDAPPVQQAAKPDYGAAKN